MVDSARSRLPSIDPALRLGHAGVTDATRRQEPKSDAPAKPAEAALSQGLPVRDVPVQLNVAMFATPGSREASVVVTAGLCNERLSRNASASRLRRSTRRGKLAVATSSPSTCPPARLIPLTCGTTSTPDCLCSRVVTKCGWRWKAEGGQGASSKTSTFPTSRTKPSRSRAWCSSGSRLSQSRTGCSRTPCRQSPRRCAPSGNAIGVAAFFQIYQGGTKALTPASITTRIVNDRDATVFEQTTELGAERFAPHRGADHSIELPLTRLPPGEYLLRAEAVAGTRRANGSARFSVQ